MSLSRAKVESFALAAGGQIAISGYARLGKKIYRPVDGVLLTWETEKQKPMIFAMIESGGSPCPASISL